jgi:hypothetical protein
MDEHDGFSAYMHSFAGRTTTRRMLLQSLLMISQNKPVRRLLGISLMLVFSLPLVSSLFGAQAADQSLPACCRRDGHHHCSMETDSGSRKDLGTVSQKCPYALASSALLLHFPLTPGTATAVFAGIAHHPAISPQTDAQLRVSFDRARQKRGPPVIVA